jgi:spore coat protein H
MFTWLDSGALRMGLGCMLASWVVGCEDGATLISGKELDRPRTPHEPPAAAAPPEAALAIAAGSGGSHSSLESAGSPGAVPLAAMAGAGGRSDAGLSMAEQPDGAATPSGGAATEPSPNWVFDETELHTYELTLDPAAWAALQRNARDEEYAESALSAGGVTLGRVGLRFKGSSGTLVSCVADDGTRLCSKLSMKLKFDEYLPDQRFLGLKRLNFNSAYWDASLMRERLAYRLFREMGVAAPRAVHARLLVNGEYQGVFSLVEEVDGRFTDEHFTSGDGNLYKEQWPNTDDLTRLSTSLTTNESSPDHSGLQQFHAALAAASEAELPGVAERYLNLDEAFAYLAVARSIRDWDGLTAFYCYGTDCENHNFYLYQHEGAPRFTWIPWDMDNTFTLVTPLDAVPGVFEVPADCSVRFPVDNRTAMAPACDPLLRGLVLSDRSRYLAQLDRLLNGPFVLDTLSSWLSAWQAQIEAAIADDRYGPGLSAFQAEISELRDNLSELRDAALRDRDTHL